MADILLRDIAIPSILIIEDHPVVRKGLASYFAGTERWRVMGTASSLSEARQLLTVTQANIALFDIKLEDGWSLDIIPWLKTQNLKHAKQLPLLAVYSAFDDYAYVSAALGLGVKAYVTKRRNEAELEEALNIVLAGGIYIDETAQAKFQTSADVFNLLTKREAEVLNLIKNGLSNKEIAAALSIKRGTVDNIISCIYDKIGITSRVELLRL